MAYRYDPSNPHIGALLDTISGPESGGAYNIAYGGKRFNDYAAHPNIKTPIASGPNAGKTSSAAGRYQFINSTWNDQASKLGLKDFTPASQDAAAANLAGETYRQKTGGDLAADLADPAKRGAVMSALKSQWSSLPGGVEQGTTASKFANSFDQRLAARLGGANPAGDANAQLAMYASQPTGQGNFNLGQTGLLTGALGDTAKMAAPAPAAPAPPALAAIAHAAEQQAPEPYIPPKAPAGGERNTLTSLLDRRNKRQTIAGLLGGGGL